tara:strand:+ start:297 stop:584 length:288 start_codon:yes stop_codon:yes gene_type:complete
MKTNYILNISAEEIQNKMDAKLTESELLNIISSGLDRMELILDKMEVLVDSNTSTKKNCVDVLANMIGDVESDLGRYYTELTKRGFDLKEEDDNL